MAQQSSYAIFSNFSPKNGNSYITFLIPGFLSSYFSFMYRCNYSTRVRILDTFGPILVFFGEKILRLKFEYLENRWSDFKDFHFWDLGK